MAHSAEERHRILWSELVSQLVCREEVHVRQGEREATGYVDRELGRFEVPTGRITVITDGEEGQILLLPDRLEVEWEAGPPTSVPLDLSNAYRANLSDVADAGPATSPTLQIYPSAREAVETLLPRLLP